MERVLTVWREAWAWPENEEKLYRSLLKGYKPVLHLFCGKSTLGDVRVDRIPYPNVTHTIEVKVDTRLPFKDGEFDATIFDPPWINQYMLWTAKEVPRVTRRRIIAVTGHFWWEPAKPHRHSWKLSKILVLKQVSPATKLCFIYDRKTRRLT